MLYGREKRLASGALTAAAYRTAALASQLLSCGAGMSQDRLTACRRSSAAALGPLKESKMSRVRAADDFETIRSRLKELRNEQAPAEATTDATGAASGGQAAAREWIPDAVAHCPPGMRRRSVPERYHRSSCP